MWFEAFYTFLGGLGIFFFGMKMLSESLQALSGNLLRRIIGILTNNRFTAVLVGILITTLVQSSSVSTVMILGLVNAGLMELRQAIGTIIGANIGTTITGWIIAVKVGKYGLLFVGLGSIPLLTLKNKTYKNIGYILISFGLVFMGLEYMSASFKPLRSSEGFIQLLSYFHADSIPTLLMCIGVGTLLTMVVQSSSAMLGITIALAASGSVTFSTAVALVLGENIGTTITAILATLGANTNAKRAARAHAIFNVVGALLLVPFFWHYVQFIEKIVGGVADELDANGERPNIAAHIAAAHTLFNVIATVVCLPVISKLEKLVIWLTPAPATKEIPHLRYLPSSLDLEAPALALAMAEKELVNLADITGRAVISTKQLLLEEKFTDSIQSEITVFLCRVQQARLSPDQAKSSHAYIYASDEFESIADYCASLARARSRRRRQSHPHPTSRTFRKWILLTSGRNGFYRYYCRSAQTQESHT